MDAEQPGSLPPEEPRKRVPRIVRELAVAMELPFIPILSVVIAGGLGYLMDSRFHTAPLFAIVLGLLGFAAGMREVFRRVSKAEKEDDRK